MSAMNANDGSRGSGAASGSGEIPRVRDRSTTLIPTSPLKAVLLALAVSGTVLPGQDYTTDKAPPVATIAVPLTPAQTAALQAVDLRIAGIEILAAKVDDAAYRESCMSAVKDLKKRRSALEKTFDPALYESLMHSVISRYQVIALWLTPPRLAPRADNSAKTAGKPGP